MNEPTQTEAYEALRTLMWELDLLALARGSAPAHEALATLCRYLTQ
jgi:hypothetical protein